MPCRSTSSLYITVDHDAGQESKAASLAVCLSSSRGGVANEKPGLHNMSYQRGWFIEVIDGDWLLKVAREVTACDFLGKWIKVRTTTILITADSESHLFTAESIHRISPWMPLNPP